MDEIKEKCVEVNHAVNGKDATGERILSNVLFTIVAVGLIIACVVFEVPYGILKERLNNNN